jgi:hypothetical protein
MQSFIDNSELASEVLSSSNEHDCDQIYIDTQVDLPSLIILRVNAPAYYGNAEFSILLFSK